MNYQGTQLLSPIELLENEMRRKFNASPGHYPVRAGDPITVKWSRYQRNDKYYFIITDSEHSNYNIRWYRVVKKYFPNARVPIPTGCQPWQSIDGGPSITCFPLLSDETRLVLNQFFSCVNGENVPKYTYIYRLYPHAL
mgnify:CR=1 FL=1